MADPLMSLPGGVAPPPPPRTRRSRGQAAAEQYVPDDAEAARRRIALSRARRKKRDPMVSRTFTLRKSLSDVLETLAEKYDVGIGAVLRRFVEDGMRTYAPDLALEAGVEVRPNPFDPMPVAAASGTRPAYLPPPQYGEEIDPAAGLDADLVLPGGGPRP